MDLRDKVSKDMRRSCGGCGFVVEVRSCAPKLKQGLGLEMEVGMGMDGNGTRSGDSTNSYSSRGRSLQPAPSGHLFQRGG